MSDTVLILGAGFSRAAGVPLLADFVDRMWEISIRGRVGDKQLDVTDKLLLQEAMTIRYRLDKYHGRAAFNDRNIEDVLSILSIEAIGGEQDDLNRLHTMSQAIARTIELTCTVTHPGVTPGKPTEVAEGPRLYRDFWKALFASQSQGRQLPTIITFNYDLVLERSLLQVLSGVHYKEPGRLPFERVQVQYHYSALPPTPYKLSYQTFTNFAVSP